MALHFACEGRREDSCQGLKFGRAPPFLLERKLSSMCVEEERRWSGALAPD